MSWSTELFCNISFIRETFINKSDVEDKIEETKLYLQLAKDKLHSLVMMTEPNKFCPEEYDPIIWIRQEFRDTMDEIEDYTIELYKLRLLLDNWEACHNEEGLAIDPPEGITWKTAFLEGDFIKSVKYPNAGEHE